MGTSQITTALINEIQTLLKKNDAGSRKQAAALSRSLTIALETPEDTAVQISFMVRSINPCYFTHLLTFGSSNLASPSLMCEISY